MQKPNLNKLLSKWQKRLRLQDWDITVQYVKPSGFKDPVSEPVGECSWDWMNSEADIRILDPAFNNSKWTTDTNVELSLIHELMHCIISPLLKRPELHEQVVEKLARSFYKGKGHD